MLIRLAPCVTDRSLPCGHRAGRAHRPPGRPHPGPGLPQRSFHLGARHPEMDGAAAQGQPCVV